MKGMAVSALLTLAVIAAIPAAAQEKARFSEAEVAQGLTAERNLVHYIHLSGVLTDLLREQKRVYHANHQGEPNTLAADVEDLLNEAGMAASRSDFDAAWASMEKSSKLLFASLKESR
ncbi:MAG: hypothetical protein HY804_11835 [Nitrospinae bacterium]|nr:hypothetical protein [Nitrospinota bacterium]